VYQMMLALSFAGVGATSVLAADETGKETVKTTVETKKGNVKPKTKKTVTRHKVDTKKSGNKTEAEDSTKTTTETK
jgi:hypothetical protein